MLSGDLKNISPLVNEALEAGIGPQEIIDNGLIEGMNELGVLWKNGEVFLPEIIVGARIMHAATDILRPLLSGGKTKTKGTIVLGTVKGDLHNIGKNLVSVMIEGAGYEVFDIGIDQPAEEFVKSAKEKNADVVGLSALLSTTMIEIPKVIDAFKDAAFRDQVKIIIGGAPVTQNLADEVGADGYAPDAPSAVDLVKRLINKK